MNALLTPAAFTYTYGDIPETNVLHSLTTLLQWKPEVFETMLLMTCLTIGFALNINTRIKTAALAKTGR